MTYRMAECHWCGKKFGTYTDARYCSKACGLKAMVFNRRRKK